MRLILVDSETELIHCDYILPERRGGPALERLCERAAGFRGAGAGLRHYALGDYRPYRDMGGYFAFLARERRTEFSPTTLGEIMSRCDYLGYLREQFAPSPSGESARRRPAAQCVEPPAGVRLH